MVALGLVAVAGGLRLLQADDPILLTLWGIAFTMIGAISIITGLGILLRIWE